ncbi:MAG: formate dehydrogenase accessory protein FdhE [Gemmatimonadota bacterium]|nr:formate dehydrogenase accessory protein FdhE [Gemmatimonadota bacterium]
MPTTLDTLAARQPELGEAAALLGALIAGMDAIDVSLPAGALHPEAVRDRLASGLPALSGEPLVSGGGLVANLQSLAKTLPTSARAAADALAARLDGARDRIDLDSVADAAVAGAWDVAAELSPALDMDEFLVVTLLDYSVRPALRAAMARVEPLIRAATWERPSCPGCGAAPLLAELRADGERVLRCGRCAAEWSFARLACVWCGETDHHKLSYLHRDGEGEFRRADVCESCRHYLKSLATLAPLAPDALLAEDLATAALDLVAIERGYQRSGSR